MGGSGQGGPAVALRSRSGKVIAEVRSLRGTYREFERALVSDGGHRLVNSFSAFQGVVIRRLCELIKDLAQVLTDKTQAGTELGGSEETITRGQAVVLLSHLESLLCDVLRSVRIRATTGGQGSR